MKRMVAGMLLGATVLAWIGAGRTTCPPGDCFASLAMTGGRDVAMTGGRGVTMTDGRDVAMTSGRGVQHGIPAASTPEEAISRERDERRFLIEAFRRRNPRLSRAEAYLIATAVQRYAEKHDLSPTLIATIIIVESDVRPDAVSPKGAVGLMQVMPHMAEALGVDVDLYNIDDNVRTGVFILADNIRRWGYREGIQRYFWGTKKRPDGRYLTKVLKTMEEVDNG